MKKILLVLTATFAVCLAVFAGTNMCVKKQNGEILRINIDDVYEVYFEDIFNPDTSIITPPHIEPTVEDVSAFAPLRFSTTSDSTVELTSGYYYDLDSVSIPAKVKIDGKVYSVTSIEEGAFEGCSLTSIKIPSSVTEIGKHAFCYCRSLASIEIPSSVTEIGEGAFAGCQSLTSANIPRYVTEINNNVFIGCNNLTSINVDANSSNFTSIDGIVYDKDVKSIILVPFGIKGEFIIPDGIVNIDTVFAHHQNITSVTIPESVTTIGYDAFRGCSLTSIKIPSSVTEIGEGAFYDCSSLTSIKIPSSVTEIGKYAFYYCDSLTSIEIPSSVTEIGEGAFEYCRSLTSVEIPSSVTEIGWAAFSMCSSLESINVDAKNPNYSSLDGIFYNKEKTEIIAVPIGIKGSVSIPSSVTSIGEYDFDGCSSLTSIVIPSSVTSIGEYAFAYCENLDVVIDNAKENVKFYRWGNETTMEESNAFYGVKSVNWLKD